MQEQTQKEKRKSGTFSVSKKKDKIKIPDATDLIKELGAEVKLETKCKVIVCHACGLKDHDYDPHSYMLPCDHPWVLAPTGAELIVGYQQRGGQQEFKLLGGANSVAGLKALGWKEAREGCGCFDRSNWPRTR